MRKNLFPIVVSLILSCLIFWPIKNAGDWYPMHDSTHLTRVILMASTVYSGQVPPLWANSLNDNLGYPLFHFYAPLFHSLATFFFFIFNSPTLALKITLFISASIGIFGAMKFASRWGRLASLMAGIAFAFSPYLASNLYVRGAYAEFLSLCLIPWVLIATESLQSKKRIILSSIALALFVLSHNLIPLLALPLIFIWMLSHNLHAKKHLLLVIILSLGLTAWFIVPVLFERGFTHTDQIAKTTNYALHFVEPWQLWNSTWGFGGSAPGVEDGMSFKIGKLQLLLALASFIIAWLKRKRSILLLGSFALFSAYLSSPFSKLLWDQLSLLQIVQFPWRALGLVTVLISLIAGYWLTIIRSLPLRLLLALSFAITMIFLNLKYFSPQSIIRPVEDNPDIALQDLPDISSTVPEYAPIWLKKEEIDRGEHFQLYMSSEVQADEESTELQGLMPWGYQFDLIASASGQISVGTAYYPTWVGEIDGTTVSLSPDQKGLVSVTIPEGKHRLTLYQSHTILEKIAILISAVTLLILVRVYVKK